jgi:hypothetical protein
MFPKTKQTRQPLRHNIKQPLQCGSLQIRPLVATDSMADILYPAVYEVKHLNVVECSFTLEIPHWTAKSIAYLPCPIQIHVCT